MLAPLDTAAEIAKYSNAGQCDAPTLETATVLQGAGALNMNKTGSGSATGTIRRKFSMPIDIRAITAALRAPALKFRVYHSSWSANVQKVFVRLLYRFDTTGVPDIYDQFDKAAPLTNGDWTVGSVALGTPSSTSATVPGNMHRSMCQGIDLGVVMANAADTTSNIKWDAIDIEAEEGTAQPAVLVCGADRVLIPPFDTWRRTLLGATQVVEAPEAAETNFHERKEMLDIGLGSTREVNEDESFAFSLEETLRRFGQYAEENNAFGVAWPAKQLIDTTVNTLAVVDSPSIVVASARDFAFLGLTGTLETKFADIRIGPSDGRNYEVCRAIGYSGTTVYLDRPLRFAHEVGTPIRSMRYYPSMVKVSEGPAVTEDACVPFHLQCRESD